MKKWNWKQIRLRQVRVDELSDRTLLLNLYATQMITLVLGLVIIAFQSQTIAGLLHGGFSWMTVLLWGIGLAVAVIVLDLGISRFVPEDVTDDGGVNDRLFANRPVWHIVVICLVVSVCEEVLFRGAIQFAIGAYWTSIVFATIHVRYLRHWLMTGLVFSISYGLGWIYRETGTLAAPIAAHFVIDLVMGLIIRFRRES